MRFPSRRAWIALALLVAIGLPVVAVLLILQRLDAGPIRLPFLDGPLAAALTDVSPHLTAEVGGASLARAGRGVALQVAGVRILANDGTPVLSLPALAVRPSLGAALRGKLVIARVDVADADLALTRHPDGAWFLGSGDGAAGVAVRDLGGASSGTGSVQRHLPWIGLTRTRVRVVDQRAGGRLDLSDGELVLAPGADALALTVSAALHLESAVPPVRGVLRLPIRAAVTVPLSAAGTLGPVDFTFTGGSGELVPGAADGAPFALRALAVAGTYHPEVETLRLARLAAVIGASQLDASATVVLRDPPVLGLDARVDALPVAVLTRFWPVELATAARTWLVENVRAGELRRCRVRLGVLADGPFSPVAVASPVAATPAANQALDAYDVACDFAGVTAHYLPPVDKVEAAPIRAAAGVARLTPARLDVDVRTGTIGDCGVEAGKLVMDLAVDPPRLAITADVSGTGAALLALVDQPPLRLVTPLGIVPRDLGGGCRARAELRLPIKTGLVGTDVGVQATATLTGASLPPLVGGIGITDGELEVRIDGQSHTVSGTTRLTGVPEVTGPVTLSLTVEPDRAPKTQRARLALDGEGVTIRGTGSLTTGVAGNTVTALAVERLRLGRNDLAGTLRRRPAGDYVATLTGASLDLERLLADPRFAGADGPGLPAAAYALTVGLGRVLAAPDLEIRDLRGAVQGAGGRLDTLALDGAAGAGGTFAASIDAAHAVSVTADQAGSLLHALFGIDQIVGGSLVLDAATDERGPQAFLEGKLVIRDFKIVRAPVLAKVLSVGSLGGIAALVQGEGLPVSKGRFRFRWEDGRLAVRDLRAVGAVGLTAEGVLDPKAATCDVRGNVIPAYTLNSALGKIPLLGQLLVGGKGEGVFGIDYRVSGKLADPTVRVNPLTSVAPTVLRTWFVDPFMDKPGGAAPARRRFRR